MPPMQGRLPLRGQSEAWAIIGDGCAGLRLVVHLMERNDGLYGSDRDGGHGRTPWQDAQRDAQTRFGTARP